MTPPVMLRACSDGFGALGGWPEFAVRRMMVATISGRGGDGDQVSERDEAGSVYGPELAGPMTEP
jgi:hypothetical protein